MKARENPVVASAETQERMARLNNMIIVILVLFLITEFPLIVMFVTYIFDIIKSNLDCNTIVDNILASIIIINSSYNTLCYFKMSSEYRRTLKMLLKNKSIIGFRQTTSSSRRVTSSVQTEETPI